MPRPLRHILHPHNLPLSRSSPTYAFPELDTLTRRPSMEGTENQLGVVFRVAGVEAGPIDPVRRRMQTVEGVPEEGGCIGEIAVGVGRQYLLRQDAREKPTEERIQLTRPSRYGHPISTPTSLSSSPRERSTVSYPIPLPLEQRTCLIHQLVVDLPLRGLRGEVRAIRVVGLAVESSSAVGFYRRWLGEGLTISSSLASPWM